MISRYVSGHWEAAMVLAVFLPSAVTLFARFNDAVAANSLLWLGETPFGTSCFRIQHRFDGLQRTWRKFIIIPLVS
jgi:hypothetical protein